MIAGKQQPLWAEHVVTESHGGRQRRDDVEPNLFEIFAGFAAEVFRAPLQNLCLMVEPLHQEVLGVSFGPEESGSRVDWSVCPMADHGANPGQPSPPAECVVQ
jgi:hypothetical protein